MLAAELRFLSLFVIQNRVAAHFSCWYHNLVFAPDCITFVASLKNWNVMESTKLVSVRLPEDLVRQLDERCGDTYSRSTLIYAGCKLILEAAKRGKVWCAVRYCPETGDVVDEYEFKYHREHR